MIRSLSLPVIGLAVLALAGCSASLGDTAQLRVGALSTQNILTLCQASGGLDDALADVGGSVTATDPFDAFAPAAEAMSAGHVDMSSAGATSVVTALAGSPDLVVFAVEQNDDDSQGIVAAADSGIAGIADLAGRTVAVNQGGTGDYLLRKALETEGMTIDDVEPVFLGPADAATAFSSGQVDAWATWDQFLASAQVEQGGRLVASAADIDARNPSVHVVSRAFLDAHPEAVDAAYGALSACADEVAEDPGILADAYRAAGASDAVAEEIVAHATPRIAPADDEFAATLADLSAFYADQGLLPEAIDTSGAAYAVER